MAACAKCGAAVSDGAGFCPVCGAAVGAAAVPAAAPPMVGYAVLPPSSGNTVLKVVLIVIAVVVGLGVLGAAAVGYIGYRAVHNGAISVGNAGVTSTDLGVDPYPNGVAVPNQTVRVKMAGHQVVTAIYTTTDAPDAVVSYFKGKMGDNAMVSQTAQGTAIQTGMSGASDHLIVSVQPNGADTKIVIVRTTGS